MLPCVFPTFVALRAAVIGAQNYLEIALHGKGARVLNNPARAYGLRNLQGIAALVFGAINNVSALVVAAFCVRNIGGLSHAFNNATHNATRTCYRATIAYGNHAALLVHVRVGT